MAAAELASPREKDERGSLSWEFEGNTSSLHCVNENKVMAPVWRNGVLLKSTGPDSGERCMGKRTHSAPRRDATHGGSPETFPPGPGTPPPSTSASSSGSEPTLAPAPAPPLEPETCAKGWLCGYDDKHHPLHPDYIRRPYPEGGMTEMACRCLPEMRCGSHRNNKTQQAEVEQQHQQ